VTARLPELLDELLAAPDCASGPPRTHGVYLFSEQGAPKYVGRTGRTERSKAANKRAYSNFAARRRSHTRPRPNEATYAYRLAFAEFIAQGIPLLATRAANCANEAFKATFVSQCARVAQMEFRVVAIDDDKLAAVFEVYAATMLCTENSWAVVVAVATASAALGAPASRRVDDPKVLSVNVVKWNFLGQYGRVWQTLDPRFQKVTTRTFWESCKRKNAPEGITVQSIKAIDSYSDSMTLPVVGHVNVEAVTLRMRYTHPALKGIQTVTDLATPRSSLSCIGTSSAPASTLIEWETPPSMCGGWTHPTSSRPHARSSSTCASGW
jgi:hypothetical protein